MFTVVLLLRMWLFFAWYLGGYLCGFGGVVICCSDWFGLVWFWVDGLVCWLFNCLVLLLGLLPLLDVVVGLF